MPRALMNVKQPNSTTAAAMRAPSRRRARRTGSAVVTLPFKAFSMTAGGAAYSVWSKITCKASADGARSLLLGRRAGRIEGNHEDWNCRLRDGGLDLGVRARDER